MKMRKCWFVLVLNVAFLFSSMGSFLPVYTGTVAHSIPSNFPYDKRLVEIIESIIQNGIGNVSLDCGAQLQMYANALGAQHGWALKMFDAHSKLQSGILEGNFANLGDFDECINVDSEESGDNGERIRGKYCFGDFGKLMAGNKPIPLNFATCFPSACSASEVQLLFGTLINGTKLDVPMNVTLDEANCQTKESIHPELTSGALITISFLAIIIVLAVLTTIYDVIIQSNGQKPAHPLLISFSLYTNTRKLMAVTANPDQMHCLNGIRVISMMWVILGHSYVAVMSQFGLLTNTKYVIEWLKLPTSMYLAGATVSVDTFYLMAGLVLAFSYMKARDKGIKFNIILFYLHRWLRLTPALGVVILFINTLLPYLGSGPVYQRTNKMTNICQEYWWSAMLYIQNYYNPDKMCIEVSWYLSVDFQLFLFSPVILLPLGLWPKQTLLGTCAAAFATMGYNYYNAVDYQLTALLSNLYGNGKDRMQRYYILTHTRAAPWLFGIILGYYIYKLKKDAAIPRIKKTTALFLWVASLSVMFVCSFVRNDSLISPEYDKWGNVLHITFVRPAWAIALCWVIFACVFGYGGVVNSLLSMPIFQVMGRLVYCHYLVHYTMIQIFEYSRRTTVRFSDLEMMHHYWGHYMFSLAIAFVWSLLFESPVIVIENCLFGRYSKPSASKKMIKLPR